MIRDWLADSSHYIYVGYLDGQAIGYIYAEVHYEPETSSRYAMESIYIHHISLKPEYQANGHGEKLMDAVKALARKKGYPRLHWMCGRSMPRRKHFSKKQRVEFTNERMWLELAE